MEYFGIILKSLRIKKHLTQKQLANKIGVRKATISAYEKSATYPSINVLIKLCRFFNVSIDYLLGFNQRFNNMMWLNDEQYETIISLINQFMALNELISPDDTNDT